MSSVQWPGVRPKGPPPTMSVMGTKVPGCVNSRIVLSPARYVASAGDSCQIRILTAPPGNPYGLRFNSQSPSASSMRRPWYSRSGRSRWKSAGVVKQNSRLLHGRSRGRFPGGSEAAAGVAWPPGRPARRRPPLTDTSAPLDHRAVDARRVPRPSVTPLSSHASSYVLCARCTVVYLEKLKTAGTKFASYPLAGTRYRSLYQRRLNSILKERLVTADTLGSRLDRIERDLARVKKTLAA